MRLSIGKISFLFAFATFMISCGNSTMLFDENGNVIDSNSFRQDPKKLTNIALEASLADNSLAAGEVLNAELTISNDTNVDVAYNFFVSATLTPVGGGNAQLLKSWNYTGFTANTNLTDSVVLTIPSSVASGDYTIAFEADKADRIQETTDDDNSSLDLALTITSRDPNPNLVGELVSLDEDAKLLNIKIHNTGLAPINPELIYYRIYVSNSSNLDSGATLLLTGDTYDSSDYATIPAQNGVFETEILLEQYIKGEGSYLIIKVDSTDLIPEQNESDNETAAQINSLRL